MKLVPFLILIAIGLYNCTNSNKAPNVSAISVNTTLFRFEEDFFAADTNHFNESMKNLEKKYPYFLSDFIQKIVVAKPIDSSTPVNEIVKNYLQAARPLYTALKNKNTNLYGLQKELQQGFKYVKYYYPTYKLPQPVTYVGLIGDPAVALTKDALAIGLQMYAGSNFEPYNTTDVQQVYPQYISRRFQPAYITAHCFQNIVSDLYPDPRTDKSLIEQMIEKGKQWYLLDKFLPTAADSATTGYTQAQINWCQQNEGIIWNRLAETVDLYTTDPTIIQNYLGEAPKTEGMPDASPGNIGQWIGLQIVKNFAAKNIGLSVQEVLATDPKKILQEAKYKPRG
jgi:hypothetical protein